MTSSPYGVSAVFIHEKLILNMFLFVVYVNIYRFCNLQDTNNAADKTDVCPAYGICTAAAPSTRVCSNVADRGHWRLSEARENPTRGQCCLPKLGRLAGRASTLSLEALLALKPDLVIDCGNADETWLSQARQVNAQTHIPWLLINGELRHTPEQLRAAGEVLGVVSRTTMQAALARRFIDDAMAFSHTPAANLRFYAARGARGLETGLQGSLHTEAAELLGLHNVAHIPGRQGLTQVSMENLLSWQPDIILVQDAVTAQFLREDPVWQGVKAVADRRILFLSGLPFGWLDAPPGINRLLGLRRLHAWLDPQVEASFNTDMQRYSELFWHSTLSDVQYQRLVTA